MKLYAITCGEFYYDQAAFTSKERAIERMDDMNCIAGYEKYAIKEC